MKRAIPFLILIGTSLALAETCPCAYWFQGRQLGGVSPSSYTIICHSNGLNHTVGWHWTNAAVLCPLGDEVKWSWDTTGGTAPCNSSTNNCAGQFTANNSCTNCTSHIYSVYMGSNVRGDGVIVTTNNCVSGTNCSAVLGFKEVLADQYNCGGERPLMQMKETMTFGDTLYSSPLKP